MIPTLLGLLVLLVGLVMLHYGLAGVVFPIPRTQAVSQLGSVTSNR